MPDSMEKRILLSFALSFLVLFVFYQFLSPPAEQPAAAPEAAEPAAPPPLAPSAAPEPAATGAEPGPAGAAPAEVGVIRTVQAESAETATLESAVYSIRVSNRGAVIESIRLLDYEGEGGETLELLDAGADTSAGWPLAMMSGSPELDEWLETGLWSIEEADGRRVRMELAAEGVEAVKEIELLGDGYQFRVTASLRDGDGSRPFGIVWQGGFGDQSTDYDPARANLIYQEEGSFERLNVTDLDPAAALPPTRYLGVEDQYFLAMLGTGTPVVPEVRQESFRPPDRETPLPLPHATVPYTGPLDVYVGPKRERDLQAADPAMAAVIDYGFFSILARPLLGLLLWIQGYVGNFGWSIVLMTALINMALFPLRLKQQLSMLKMQKIQPQMRTLQDRYKKLKPNDPRRQEVQTEMMGLYQKHGVNPLGGCLPLLLQMPIFFAIFQLLQMAIELRQAPWILWIDDLSVYDPTYVLPILMGVSMVVSQRMMPTTMDPAQARIMMFMPLLFMVFMVFAQSGLVLYWLTSQVIGVGQQVLIMRYWGPERKAERPAAPPPESEAPEAEPEKAPAAEDPAGRATRKRRRKK